MIATIDYTDSPYSTVLVNKDLRTLIFQKLIEKYKILLTTPLGKKINIEPKALRSFLTGRKIEVHTLERLRKKAEISIDTLRKNIVSLDNIKNPNLPLNFDCEEGIRLIAGIINEGRIRARTIEYHNKNEEVLKIITKCAKKVIGRNFRPSSSIDKRQNVKCLYFPPFFAKYFIRIGLSKPKIYPFSLPEFITNGPEDYLRTWLRACVSEDASLYPFVHNQKGFGISLYPYIQLNRNVIILDNIKTQLNGIFLTSQQRLYKVNLNQAINKKLEKLCHPLLLQESSFLQNFGICCPPKFSSTYMSKDKIITATHSLSIHKIEDLDIWLNEIGFELSWQRKQLELLLSNVGKIHKTRLNDIVFKFYNLIPPYLRDKRKIRTSNVLTEEQKSELFKRCSR